jgi:hypothetical protein
VRGDTALTARLLLFGHGRVGLVVAIGGALTVTGALLPWYELVATVTMLGEDAERTVAALRGVPDLLRGAGALAAGLALVGLGLALGIDRPPPGARTVTVLASLTAAVLAIGSLIVRPSVTTLARQGGADLISLRDELPVGIDLTFAAVTAGGCWLVLTGALIALGGAIATLRSREP